MRKLQKCIALPMLACALLLFGAWTYEEPQDRYADAPVISAYADEYVYYTNKEVDEATTAGGAPQYSQLNEHTNACGAVAGAEIVAFYDKYYGNLIPNWTSYYTASGRYRMQDATYVPALMRDLYTRMRTNVDDVGVSENEFKNGLQSYINAQGYGVSYQNIASGGVVDYDACKAAVQSNKVIALLVRAGNVYTITDGNGYDVITPTNIAGLHIMVAYGYKTVTYYNASGVFRTDVYLGVATGLISPKTAYYRVNAGNLNAAYIVSIN
ncbi:MAG: hypothetical protein K2L51_05380 [Clostridiales bacterium]|nr:hypothetical protein [Clostridiales bacterium]